MVAFLGLGAFERSALALIRGLLVGLFSSSFFSMRVATTTMATISDCGLAAVPGHHAAAIDVEAQTRLF